MKSFEDAIRVKWWNMPRRNTFRWFCPANSSPSATSNSLSDSAIGFPRINVSGVCTDYPKPHTVSKVSQFWTLAPSSLPLTWPFLRWVPWSGCASPLLLDMLLCEILYSGHYYCLAAPCMRRVLSHHVPSLFMESPSRSLLTNRCSKTTSKCKTFFKTSVLLPRPPHKAANKWVLHKTYQLHWSRSQKRHILYQT